MRLLKTIENDYLKVDIFDNGSIVVVNKEDATQWEMSNVALQEEGTIVDGFVWFRNERTVMEQYWSFYRAEVCGEVLLFKVYDIANSLRGTFECSVCLEEDELHVSVSNIDENLESLAFPGSFKELTSFVTTVNQGMWIREPEEKHYFYPAIGQGTCMRWFGSLQDEAGCITIFDKGVTDAGILYTGLEITPVWLKSLDKWQGEKELVYKFSSNGNYVSLAKIFRKYAMQNGLYKSLNDKIKENPNVGKIVEGRDVYFLEARPKMPKSMDEYNLYCRPDEALGNVEGNKFKDFGESGNTFPTEVVMSHAKVREKYEYLVETDTRGLVQVGGWQNSGYDGRYPDVWPFDETLGTTEEFKALFNSGYDIVAGFHDNYQDMYKNAPSFPHGLIVTKNGSYMRGGLWAGGQSFLINSRNSVEYQKRNWEHLEELGMQFVYSDTICAVSYFESFEKGNELTRQQDLEYKNELMKFYKARGLVFGTEGGRDEGIPYVDWLASNAPRHPGKSIPLFGLVYHDAIVCGNGVYDDFDNITPEGSYPALLKMMLWGEQLHYWVVGEDGWEKYKEMDLKSRYLDEWFAKVSTVEMLSHQFVTEDGSVEETVFATGDRIVVNFSDDVASVEGLEIPAYGYKILKV